MAQPNYTFKINNIEYEVILVTRECALLETDRGQKLDWSFSPAFKAIAFLEWADVKNVTFMTTTNAFGYAYCDAFGVDYQDAIFIGEHLNIIMDLAGEYIRFVRGDDYGR